MIDIPITRVQLLAPPEVRETRKCEDCAFYYYDDCGDHCNLGKDCYERNVYEDEPYYKTYRVCILLPCKSNFTPEEIQVILEDVLELELYFQSYSNGIEYITIAGVND